MSHRGLRRISPDDDAAVALGLTLYDALYAYCQAMVAQGKPDGAFKPEQR
jgi:hypothetical protein